MRLPDLRRHLRGESVGSAVCAARQLAPGLAGGPGRVLASAAALRRHTQDSVRPGPDGGTPDYYGPAHLGAATIGHLAGAQDVHDAVLAILDRLAPDDYADYVARVMREGRGVAGESWRYADIATVLCAASRLLRPNSYLEIGVRRGRSMAVVAATNPSCAVFGVDMWEAGYAGMENPGPDFVRDELARVGHEGPVELRAGDSHKVLPALFLERPALTFDLVTVDGDHTSTGARRDLLDVLPRLRIGGALVFDDIAHPSFTYLADVWGAVVARDDRYSTWAFTDVGYGVAVAVRRW